MKTIKLNLGSGNCELSKADSKYMPKMAGVYGIIVNLTNGKWYIGSTNSIRKRMIGHLSKLKHGSHCNAYLQSAWNKYGKENFALCVLRLVRDETLLTYYEQAFIEKLNSTASGHGYNLIVDAFRHIPGPETRKKISMANKGRVPWSKGIPCTDSVKEKIRVTLTGRIKTQHEIDGLRKAMLGPSHPHRGKKSSLEWRTKMSESKRMSAGTNVYKGVSFDKRTKTFMSRIYCDGKQYFLGRYKTQEEAAFAYNIAAKKYYKGNCYLNQTPEVVLNRNTKLGRLRRMA
ncbi:hypothetical protein LCGC14_2852500 [marine sediment metagenome]|uniref:AP2/ERF domain-containing protein n=1 Tax=marine sediment metagenome TaxID=412755 RepID=A0A0F9AYX2_9ZZZZ